VHYVTVTERVDGAGCDLVALVPRRAESAMLLCTRPLAADGGALTLPSIQVGPDPGVGDIVPRLVEMLQGPVKPLRANELSWHPNFDAASMIMELEPWDAELPEGFCWRSIDESVLASVSPEWARPAVAAWLDERTTGWSDLRPQWSRPGWLARAGAWMQSQMELAGYIAPAPPCVHHLWGVSVVLASDSLSGTAYLKCSGDRFRTEAAVTRSLAERSPLLLPEVVAIEPEHGWLLMRDLNAPELGDQDESTWGVGLDALAELQRTWLGRTRELGALGAEVRSLTALMAWVEELATDTELLGRLTADERLQWSGATSAMVEACRRLSDLGPGSSLVHGDFHPWNVVAGDAGVRIFDWTDASVAHPFLDLVTYVMRSSDPGRRRTMLRQYLVHWSWALSAEALEEAGRLALVVGALHQARTYAELIPTVMPDDLGQLRNGDVQWIRRAMRYADQGLESGY
jgi:hypothetical protein